MPRFEHTEGSSSTYWEIKREGSVLITRSGPIGTDGQEQIQTLRTDFDARQDYQKQVREKTRAGFTRVKPKDTAPAPLSNPEFEEAILRDPKSEDGYLAYAEWLKGQGDPRGELITLQHAQLRAQVDEALHLKRKVTALQKQHEGTLLGVGLTSMQDAKALVTGWQLGFIHSARIMAPDNDADADFNSVETLTMLLRHPSGRFLRDLTLGIPSLTFHANYADLIKVLTQWAPRTLTRLFIGDFEHPDESELSRVYLGDLENLLKALPQLTSLRLRGTNVRLGTLELPELRRFVLESAGMSMATVQSIASANWPKLEHLELGFGGEDYSGPVQGKDLQPILDATGLPKLIHLGLCDADFSDQLVPLLATSKLLKQLKSLDLSKGTLTDDDAEAMLDNASAFKHLKRLDVTQNRLTKKGVKRVTRVCPNVAAGNQRKDDDDRYSTVGE